MKLWAQLGMWWRRKQREKILQDELQGHLDELSARNLAAGMSPEEARYAAQRQFGNVVGIRERSREAWSLVWLEQPRRDFVFSLRSLRRSPAFSVTVVATLGLCIWANTSVFSVLYGLVLKPLPFADAGQIVDICNVRPKVGLTRQQVGVGQYLDYKAHADLFSSFGLWAGWMFNLEQESGAQRYVGMRVTADYFATLGVQPLMGRFFTADECQAGKDNVVVLTHAFWQNQFQQDPNILGREIELTRRRYTVIGVLPPSFEKVSVAPLLLKPFEWKAEMEAPRARLAGMGHLYARIKPGVAHETALAQLQLLEDRNREAVADPGFRDHLYSGGHRMGLRHLRAEQMEPVKTGLVLLQVGAFFVLLLGCVNVAGLMLARANARQAEFAVRQALGAGRGVLARQLLTEAAVLAVASAALGLTLTAISLRVINLYVDKIVYGIPPVGIDGDMLALTLVGSLGVALITGLFPVARVWRAESFRDSMHSGTRSATGPRKSRRVSSALVVAQVAFALVLLVGAGLLTRSFAKVMVIDPGFDAAQIIYLRVSYDPSYGDPLKLKGLQERILERMRELPGVESVAYSAGLPGFGEDRLATLPLRGMTSAQAASFPTAVLFPVSPEYLSTMGIRLLEGRHFTADDLRPGARPVFIVDRKFAQRHFPDRSPVGETFDFTLANPKPEVAPVIIGVAEVARVSGLEKRNVEPYVYSPLGVSSPVLSYGLSVELRTKRAFAEIMPQIRGQIRAVDPTLPIYGEQTMQMRLDDAAANRRGILWLLAAFAGIALLLAAVGLYGMLAYDVAQRTKEIGIRGAVGATRGAIVRMILKQGLSKVGAGVLFGLLGAFLLSRHIAAMLFEVEPNDPLIFAAVTGTLLLVAFLASWLPARRAARIDPLVALRQE